MAIKKIEYYLEQKNQIENVFKNINKNYDSLSKRGIVKKIYNDREYKKEFHREIYFLAPGVATTILNTTTIPTFRMVGDEKNFKKAEKNLIKLIEVEIKAYD